MKYLDKKMVAQLLAAFIFVLFLRCAGTIPELDLSAEIGQAKEKGQILFLAAIMGSDSLNARAVSLARQAARALPDARALVLDRTDSTTANWVRQFKLHTINAPVILVLARQGYVAGGGLTSELTVDKLLEIAPSPREEDISLALLAGKPVFMLIYRKENPTLKQMAAVCESASRELNPSGAIIAVDASDSHENRLFARYKIPQSGSFPLICVVNAKGQLTGMFEADVSPDDLVSAAQRTLKKRCSCSKPCPID